MRAIKQQLDYLEKHELHELVDVRLQDFNDLLVDLASVGLFVALDLTAIGRSTFSQSSYRHELQVQHQFHMYLI